MRISDFDPIEACEKGDTATLQRFLKHRLDPNHRDRAGRTLTIIAAEHGHIDIIDLLVQHGANPHLKTPWGTTALHYAVKNRHYPTVQYLITKLKLDPNLQEDNNNNFPFLIAAQNNDLEMIKLLVSLGANPHVKCRYGDNAIHYTAEKSNIEITQYLITQLKIDPNIPNQFYITPFLIATKNGDIKMIELLTQLGVKPFINDQYNIQAFYFAIKNNHLHTLEYLITKLNMDPNTPYQGGITPFMIAAETSDINTLKLLISLGANPYAIDDHGRTALHYAAAGTKNHNILQFLTINLNFDPNAQDRRGYTPIIFAAKKGNLRSIQYLNSLGANPHATDKKGRNALHHAIIKKQYLTSICLITHHHLNPNSQDHQGNTPLHLAMKKQNKKIIRKLIQLGANPHIPNHQGETPTTYACRRQIPLKKPKPSTITL